MAIDESEEIESHFCQSIAVILSSCKDANMLFIYAWKNKTVSYRIIV